MVVADPSAELIDMIRSMGDPAPATAPAESVARAELLRRRFGLALPPPFVPPPEPGEGVRPADALDGPAIAAVKWRCFGTNYRGVFPDAFLDSRDVVPPAGYWTGRAMVPPSRRHGLFVWGRRGAVHGYVDCGPADGVGRSVAPRKVEGDVGEVFELYVDPSRQASGGGRLLLSAAESFLSSAGFDSAELSVVDTNHRARRFYLSAGWSDTERVTAVDLGVLDFVERRFERRLVR